ncbi:MAG TPA: hypothetical protein VE954_13530 [Oligoflexus sp.]|uniref:hypothetical protein n=1 Tax=Oligoflexus sp. TaxID=1971216 RepID=UPI002D33DBD9|nr:hypothetical protein [Oligoflexus sp.]HYX34124.1 hypothetical protein [Oligoflexus sp.]
MIETPYLPKFLASGIGLSGSRIMSKIRKKKIKDLLDITIYCPEDGDEGAFNLDGELRTLEWLENEIASIDLLLLTADFSNQSTFELFPDVMAKATEHGIFVFVFPVNGPIRGKLGYHAITNEKIFFVEPVEHLSASQDEIVVNGIKAISDITFAAQPMVVDYWDIKHSLDSYPGFTVLGQGEGATCELAVQGALTCFSEAGVDLEKAKGFIVGVAVGKPPEMQEVVPGLHLIQEAAHEDADIVWGFVDDPTLGANIRVSVFAFGFDARPITSS